MLNILLLFILFIIFILILFINYKVVYDKYMINMSGEYYDDESDESEAGADDQSRLQKALAEQYKRIQIEQQKKELMRNLLDDQAYERLMNIRASNPDLYSQIVNIIISLVQTGRLQGKLSEKQFLAILQKLTTRQEPTINYKHK